MLTVEFEQVAGDHRQLVVGGAVLAGRIDRMEEQRDGELRRGIEDRPEPLVRQIDAAHVGGDMAADESMIAHAAAQLCRCRLRVLHRQEGPGCKSCRVARCKLGEAVVADLRRLHRRDRIEIVVDQGRRQRNRDPVDAEAFHAGDLALRLEEGAVEPVRRAPALEIDVVAFHADDPHIELRL